MKKFYKQPTMSIHSLDKADVLILSTFDGKKGEGVFGFDASSDLYWG